MPQHAACFKILLLNLSKYLCHVVSTHDLVSLVSLQVFTFVLHLWQDPLEAHQPPHLRRAHYHPPEELLLYDTEYEIWYGIFYSVSVFMNEIDYCLALKSKGLSTSYVFCCFIIVNCVLLPCAPNALNVSLSLFFPVEKSM